MKDLGFCSQCLACLLVVTVFVLPAWAEGVGRTGGRAGGQKDPNPGGGGGSGDGDGFGPIIDGCFLLIPPDGVGLALTAPPWPYPDKHEELNIEQKIELFGGALLDPSSVHYMGKREIKRQLREFRAKNYPAGSIMTTAPTSNELSIIKEIRKPAWNEPGGWGYEGFGPEGAAYELIAVAAGGAAIARGKVRSGPAPQNLPTALVPQKPTVTPPLPEQILRELNDGIFRPGTLRALQGTAAITLPGHSYLREGDAIVHFRGMRPSTNVVRATRDVVNEIERAGHNVLFLIVSGTLVPDQVTALRAADFDPSFHGPGRPQLHHYSNVIDWIEAMSKPRSGHHSWSVVPLLDSAE